MGTFFVFHLFILFFDEKQVLLVLDVLRMKRAFSSVFVITFGDEYALTIVI